MNDNKVGVISKVAGPLIIAKGMTGVKMYDVVRVSDNDNWKKFIELRGDRASIQVYEETEFLTSDQCINW